MPNLDPLFSPVFVDASRVHHLDGWEIGEDNLSGSRPKQVLFCPKTQAHRIFKFAKRPHERAQVWSEATASFIAGDLLGMEVQHVSIGKRGERIGNVLQFVYNRATETFEEGESWVLRVNPSFEVKEGRDHTIDVFLEASEAAGINPTDAVQFLAKLLAFDALISNSDRHQENWAFKRVGDVVDYAPLYDNGTSLGASVAEETLSERWCNLTGAMLDQKIHKHLRNGRHHFRHSPGDRHGVPFGELCRYFCERFPETRVHFEAAAAVDLSPLDQLYAQFSNLSGIPEDHIFTENRAKQFTALLKGGQERLKAIFRE